MSKLPLAVEIADVVSGAADEPGPFDLEDMADRLCAEHPEAGATRSEVAEALLAEGVAAGVIPPKPREL